MQLFYCSNIAKGENFLNPEESRHCAKVLRKISGDQIDITDGFGKFYQASLTDVNHKKCLFDILSSNETEPNNHSIHIAIAPTKNTDRIEWFIEKSVEIGIDKISFIQTIHSERKTINIERIKRKAVSAMKQSMRSYLPEISIMTKLPSFMNSINDNGQKFIAHLENDRTPHLRQIVTSGSDVTILIGPEGGFEGDEISMAIDQQFKVVKIGNYRLRTETAGIAACTILNNIN